MTDTNKCMMEIENCLDVSDKSLCVECEERYVSNLKLSQGSVRQFLWKDQRECVECPPSCSICHSIIEENYFVLLCDECQNEEVNGN